MSDTAVFVANMQQEAQHRLTGEQRLALALAEGQPSELPLPLR